MTQEEELQAKVDKYEAKLKAAKIKLRNCKQANCKHTSMSGNGLKMTCNYCGYVKIAQVYY